MSHIRGLSVFAVGDRSVQLTWTDAYGELRFDAGPARATIDIAGGPGAVVLAGLTPGESYLAGVSAGGSTIDAARFRTVSSPPGPELFRFSTLNDLHLGCLKFGVVLAPRDDPDNPDPYPFRCARNAVDESAEWGSKAVIVKGDAVDYSTEENWREVKELHDHAHAPMWITMGNHEVKPHNEIDPALGARRADVELVDGVRVHDVPGLRIVLVNTSIPGRGRGEIAPLADDVLDACAETSEPVFIAAHHNFATERFPPVFPPGIPVAEARAFMRRLIAAKPQAFVSSGHTHRNRRNQWGPVVATEVASTKDWPGVWAGYAVHEGGIRQIVRRVSEPSSMRWVNRSRKAGFGAWGVYAPGFLRDRCFTHVWPS